MKQHQEVLVVGAGPVGLVAALSLARRGVDVGIVDTGLWPCKHSYALALHSETWRALDEFGLAKPLLAASYPVTSVGLYDDVNRKAGINCDPMAVVRQDVLEELLEGKLREYGVEVQWRHQLARLDPGPSGVKATVQKLEKESRGYIVAHSEWVVAKTTEADAAFVVGADGHNSLVRRALGLEFPEVGPARYFAVFEFESDADLDHEVKVAFAGGAANILWPLPGGSVRWGFQLPNYHDRQAEAVKDSLLKSGFGYFPTERTKDRSEGAGWEQMPQLEESALRELIAMRAPWFAASIGNIAWRTIVRFEQRMASAFGRDRAWLAGDAAHLTGPAGVQSMNLGMLEAVDLSESLAAILKRGASPARLTDFNNKWSQVWRQLLGIEKPLQAAMSTDPWIAKHAGDLVACLPAYGAGLAALGAQVGLLAEDHPAAAGLGT